MKKKKKQLEKGFTLIETMVTMSIFFFILFSVYMMIQHYGDVSKTEYSRMTMQQESRYMVSSFADELKEAGAVLTISHTGGFLGAAPFFNGIYPLNSQYYPDGVIIATGDPEAVTVLTDDFNQGETVLDVRNAGVNAYDPAFPYENPQWTAGQKGIVIGTTGYFVFAVASADPSANTITMRDTPVYYSGLLASSYYYDNTMGNPKGNEITYSVNSPVIRLTNFSIYMFRDTPHPRLTDDYGNPQAIRQMVRVTDSKGSADPFAAGSNAEFSVISENIWDMQISYKAYADFSDTSITRTTSIDPNHLYFTQGSAYTDPYSAFSSLMQDIRERRLKQVDVTVIAIADQLGGQGEALNVGEIPHIGDNNYINLPNRKLTYRLFSFSIEPKNFNIIL
jgi:type II secretory pathway pseudopilin PulG